MTEKYAFLDRDGTLIFEPSDTKQVDSVDLLKILPCVIPVLKNLKSAGYRLCMVTNQDGLGTSSFPKKDFEKPQKKLLELLGNESISFDNIFICPHRETDNCQCRKPKTQLLDTLFKQGNVDLAFSFVVGDRASDAGLAQNLCLPFFPMETNGRFPRIGACERTTLETSCSVLLNLDGNGTFCIQTGIAFFDHMLEQFSKHSFIDLFLATQCDLDIDAHHTVEDTALTLGKALLSALGDKRGIRRFADTAIPMDEALALTALDLSGRPYLVFQADFQGEKVGALPTDMVEHFFQSLTSELRATLHLSVPYGKNDHHKIEALFKAFAKAMRTACEIDPRRADFLPTTKGTL